MHLPKCIRTFQYQASAPVPWNTNEPVTRLPRIAEILQVVKIALPLTPAESAVPRSLNANVYVVPTFSTSFTPDVANTR